MDLDEADTGLGAANLGLRFLLELGALVALALWGARAGRGPVASWALGVLAPLSAAVLWGLVVSPKARLDIGPAPTLAVELLVFGAASLGLAAAGAPLWSALFGAAVVVHEGLRWLIAHRRPG